MSHVSEAAPAAARSTRNLVAAVPYTIHTVLTDNGTQLTNRQGGRPAFVHIVDRACREHGSEHRPNTIAHPRANGQVERTNRTREEATVSRYRYATHQRLREHPYNFLNADNFAKRLKTLQGLTPYRHSIGCWQREPQRFHVNPHHHTLGLNT